MNSERLESLLLLEHSGELTPDQEQELADLLSTADDAVRRKTELEHLITLAQEPDIPLTPASSMEQIIGRAKRSTPSPLVFPRSSRPLLALAASLLLIAGLWLVFGYRSAPAPQAEQSPTLYETYAWEDGMDEALYQLDQQVSSIGEELAMDDLDALADELLALEGWTI